MGKPCNVCLQKGLLRVETEKKTPSVECGVWSVETGEMDGGEGGANGGGRSKFSKILEEGGLHLDISELLKKAVFIEDNTFDDDSDDDDPDPEGCNAPTADAVESSSTAAKRPPPPPRGSAAPPPVPPTLGASLPSDVAMLDPPANGKPTAPVTVTVTANPNPFPTQGASLPSDVAMLDPPADGKNGAFTQNVAPPISAPSTPAVALCFKKAALRHKKGVGSSSEAPPPPPVTVTVNPNPPPVPAALNPPPTQVASLPSDLPMLDPPANGGDGMTLPITAPPTPAAATGSPSRAPPPPVTVPANPNPPLAKGNGVGGSSTQKGAPQKDPWSPSLRKPVLATGSSPRAPPPPVTVPVNPNPGPPPAKEKGAGGSSTPKLLPPKSTFSPVMLGVPPRKSTLAPRAQNPLPATARNSAPLPLLQAPPQQPPPEGEEDANVFLLRLIGHVRQARRTAAAREKGGQ